jgi:uncharacterized protein YjbJ (UPF0337 family)
MNVMQVLCTNLQHRIYVKDDRIANRTGCTRSVRQLFVSTHATEPTRGIVMNQDIIKGQWKQLSGNIKQHWGKLTDNDLKVAEGSTEYLTGKVEERYGIAHDEALKQVRAFEREMSKRNDTTTHH